MYNYKHLSVVFHKLYNRAFIKNFLMFLNLVSHCEYNSIGYSFVQIYFKFEKIFLTNGHIITYNII